MRYLPTIYLSILMMSTAALGQQGSPTTVDLKGAIAVALRENPIIISAERATDASSARVSSALSVKGPALFLRSNYGYVNKETSFSGVPILEKNTLTNGLVLEKLVYSGGKADSMVSQARSAQTAAFEGSRAVKDAVTVRVAEAYYRARMAREGTEVAHESVRSLQASYDSAVKLRDAGMVTRADVLRAEVELVSAKERLLSAGNDYNIAVAALKTSMGLDQDAKLQLAENPSDPDNFETEKVEPKERHEISGMKAALAAADAGIKAARSSNLPQVFVQADLQNIAKGAFFPRRDNSAAFGVAVKMPVWDSGAARASVAEAQSMHSKTEEDLRTLIQNAQLEVESGKLNLATARAKSETTKTRVSAAEESLRVLQAGYVEGITPLTDVFAAQSALAGARFNRIATKYDMQIAQVRLLTAMGRADLLQHGELQ